MKLSSREVEEKYTDVLQNIEAAIVGIYRKHSEMVDWDVQKAVEGLIRNYQAESSGRPAPELTLKPLSREVYDRARSMCEWRLGRIQLQAKSKKGKFVDMPMEPITIDEIVACLKRIQRSIEKWGRRSGQQGYLQFVSQFIG